MVWAASWAWSLPVMVMTVVIHVLGIALITGLVEKLRTRIKPPGRFKMASVLIIGLATFAVTTLHGLEAFVWAVAYRTLDALPTQREAMLYSLGAITAYGHEAFSLDRQWQMMGAIEALNGLLLLGLTTAFLFAVMQRAWDKS